jgi:hypothetical protein
MRGAGADEGLGVRPALGGGGRKFLSGTGMRGASSGVLARGVVGRIGGGSWEEGEFSELSDVGEGLLGSDGWVI